MLDFRHVFQAISVLIIGIGIAWTLIMMTGCATGNPRPNVAISTWAGDSEKIGIIRNQNGTKILCADPLFDTMMCMSYDDFAALYGMTLKCRQW